MIINIANKHTFNVNKECKKLAVCRKPIKKIGQQLKFDIYRIRKDGRPCKRIGKTSRLSDQFDIDVISNKKVW